MKEKASSAKVIAFLTTFSVQGPVWASKRANYQIKRNRLKRIN
jgi:hypothetical protein